MLKSSLSLFTDPSPNLPSPKTTAIKNLLCTFPHDIFICFLHTYVMETIPSYALHTLHCTSCYYIIHIFQCLFLFSIMFFESTCYMISRPHLHVIISE